MGTGGLKLEIPPGWKIKRGRIIPAPNAAPGKILQYLKRHNSESTREELVTSLGLKKETINMTINQLKTIDLVKTDGNKVKLV